MAGKRGRKKTKSTEPAEAVKAEAKKTAVKDEKVSAEAVETKTAASEVKKEVKTAKTTKKAAVPKAKKSEAKKAPEVKAAEKAPEKPVAKAEEKASAEPKAKPEKVTAEKVETKPAAAETKTEEKVPEPVKEEVKEVEVKEEKAVSAAAEEPVPAAEVKEEKTEEAAESVSVEKEKTEEKEKSALVEEEKTAEVTESESVEKKEEEQTPLPEPRRSVAFIGSECYPFVKTGGLGDVMYALPKALVAQNCDVHVILPRYKCIKEEWQDKMIYKGAFDMDLCSDGHRYYVGIMEYVWDGVVYDFIDNEEFFSSGNPYTNLVDDIPKFCYFSKAALAALNYMDWIPDIIHCHDWQAGLVPVFLREMFQNTPLSRSKVILTIHNLRFQGVYNIPTIKYWTNLPDYVFNKDALAQAWTEANMLKGGLTYSNMITTVSNTYAQEIQTPEYGEGLDAHLRYHSGKLRGIVNGIDYGMWDPSKDKLLAADYDVSDVLEKKKVNKTHLQEELGLEVDEGKFVVGLISRLTNQKGLDLVNEIVPQMMDGNTQFVVLGTGDPQYEDSFRYYENAYKGSVCSNIMYDEGRAHKIYAGCDALLVPSRFEPCGLTQLIAMHYGTIPVVRETGGLKDTVQPYNMFTNEGNGYTFDRYESGLLLDAVNRAKTLYFTGREYWDDMVKRDMEKDVSWDVSAKQYRQLYLDLT